MKQHVLYSILWVLIIHTVGCTTTNDNERERALEARLKNLEDSLGSKAKVPVYINQTQVPQKDIASNGGLEGVDVSKVDNELMASMDALRGSSAGFVYGELVYTTKKYPAYDDSFHLAGMMHPNLDTISVLSSQVSEVGSFTKDDAYQYLDKLENALRTDRRINVIKIIDRRTYRYSTYAEASRHLSEQK